MRLDAWPATPSFFSGSEFRALLRLSSLVKLDGKDVVVDWICCQLHGHVESPPQGLERSLAGVATTFPAFEDRIRDVPGVSLLFASRSSIVACNVVLGDKGDSPASIEQRRWSCFAVSARIPPFLPPSYVGRGSRISYGLTIGVQVISKTEGSFFDFTFFENDCRCMVSRR